MNAEEIVGRLQIRGVRLIPNEEQLQYEAPRGTLTPNDLEVLKAHKGSVLAYLTGIQAVSPETASLADSLEVSIALGQRLRRGEIAAVCCGITGKCCTFCQGIPCLGSIPWVWPK